MRTGRPFARPAGDALELGRDAVADGQAPYSDGGTATRSVGGVVPGQGDSIRAIAANGGPSRSGAYGLIADFSSTPIGPLGLPNTVVPQQPGPGGRPVAGRGRAVGVLWAFAIQPPASRDTPDDLGDLFPDEITQGFARAVLLQPGRAICPARRAGRPAVAGRGSRRGRREASLAVGQSLPPAGGFDPGGPVVDSPPSSAGDDAPLAGTAGTNLANAEATGDAIPDHGGDPARTATTRPASRLASRGRGPNTR